MAVTASSVSQQTPHALRDRIGYAARAIVYCKAVRQIKLMW